MKDFTSTLKPRDPSGPSILAHERSQSAIFIPTLSTHLLGPSGLLTRQSKILPILESEPLFNKSQQANLSRPERFKLALARGKLLRRLADKHSWTPEEHETAEYLVDDVSPYMLHMGMFVTTVREQASDEQRKYWLPLIEEWKIIGAYAQTELGHGSNVRGLELEARYDITTREFVLHSPTLTACKWWNGTLGRTANHAIVVAQLLLPDPGTSPIDNENKNGDGTANKGDIKYKSHGPHPFIVQVRDMKTHQPLPGIVIGDIGPKYGYATMDNAYMLFDNFRIPHSSLLSRYTTVHPSTAHYTKPAQSALVYGTLTFMRSKIIQHARLVLARAVTVAVRYTAIRQQFQDRDSNDPNSPELRVLDYPTVQIRILPLLATTFALHYTGLAMQSIYTNTRSEIERGEFGGLAYMHSMSSGLKSLCTTLAADGIEICRRALGGHGFGGGSGLVQLNGDYLSKVTVEGDNWMITQQTAAYLVKKMTSEVKGGRKDIEAFDEVDAQFRKYLPLVTRGGESGYNILGSDLDFVRCFKHRATALAYNAYHERVVKKRPWNSLMIDFHKLSKAQSQSILVTQFYHALSTNKDLDQPTREVLWSLFRLFASYTIQEDRYEFYTTNAASQSDLDRLPEKINELMVRIRPHAVRLVDAWKIPDYLLDSALGRYDGKVYEDLFNRAHRLNPLNKITVNPNYWEDEIVKGGEDLQSIRAKL
ncbi:acyl-CoA dehydrogenase/oxidase C-terminal [Aspergillus karnatakaensis]|uniref:acyl-CoA dehydrogenase/oxidase C-terminal n=1 Tax=Aspergillus karnatakaensis TaxID=1810916 RepID=UPI003CCCAE7C